MSGSNFAEGGGGGGRGWKTLLSTLLGARGPVLLGLKDLFLVLIVCTAAKNMFCIHINLSLVEVHINPLLVVVVVGGGGGGGGGKNSSV